jgi:hypothetical protein
LTWDADTIPLKKINYFPNNKPSFIEKKEYHKAYFNTLEKLFSGSVYRVDEKTSYIAENMMLNRNVIKEIITIIENNDKIKGNFFYDKIIETINSEDFESGFSEFETYGNYIRLFHPDMYSSIKLKTLRNASFFIGEVPEREQLEWAKLDYDIVSIEGQQFFIANLSKKKFFRSCFKLRYIAKTVLRLRSIRRNILGKEKLDYD